MNATSSSHPTRGAWIEMAIDPSGGTPSSSSHPTRGAWIEMAQKRFIDYAAKSHPTRGAWIEIFVAMSQKRSF